MKSSHILTTSRNPDGAFVRDFQPIPASSGAAGYPEPFDIKYIKNGVVTIRYLEFAVGNNVYSTSGEKSISLATGVIYAKIDTSDWSVDSLTISAQTNNPSEVDEGRYTYKPLYLVDRVGTGSAVSVVRDLRGCDLPRWT